MPYVGGDPRARMALERGMTEMSKWTRNQSPDPRGPVRTIIAVECPITHHADGRISKDNTLLTFSCGHVGTFANHFTYKVGSEARCFACREK
jgi:hypothetical protein